VSAPRTAIVTGAAQGIGAGITASLLDDGHRVVAVDILGGALASLAEGHAVHADRLLPVQADVTDPKAWRALVGQANARFGRVGILVNNAAISPKRDGRRLASDVVPLTEWEQVVAVNLTGPFLGFQATIADMREEGWGRIVNIASTAAQQGARVAGVHYGATKAGLLGLTRTLAWEFGEHGVTVNAVAPGRIMTPMAAGVSEDVNQRMLAGIPVGRFGSADDIAGAISFLVSERAGFVTGELLSVNGGAYMG
jgi:3-oxoacyl-[acyl-carrier protein] reductase